MKRLVVSLRRVYDKPLISIQVMLDDDLLVGTSFTVADENEDALLDLCFDRAKAQIKGLLKEGALDKLDDIFK